MRKMFYVLVDGTRVETWAEAVRSRQSFKMKFEDIPEKRPDLLPKQAANVKAVKPH